MFQKVFGSVWKGAVLFTHYHGDHYGLFKEIPDDVPMYIGSLAKDILEILVPYMDRGAEKKGLPAVERMRTYEAGIWITPVPGIQVLPLYLDHSALDSYMFYIRVSGKSILFTGDFREHGIVGQRGRLERVLKTYVPGPVGKASPDWGFHETSPVVSFRHGRGTEAGRLCYADPKKCPSGGLRKSF